MHITTFSIFSILLASLSAAIPVSLPFKDYQTNIFKAIGPYEDIMPKSKAAKAGFHTLEGLFKLYPRTITPKIPLLLGVLNRGSTNNYHICKTTAPCDEKASVSEFHALPTESSYSLPSKAMVTCSAQQSNSKKRSWPKLGLNPGEPHIFYGSDDLDIQCSGYSPEAIGDQDSTSVTSDLSLLGTITSSGVSTELNDSGETKSSKFDIPALLNSIDGNVDRVSSTANKATKLVRKERHRSWGNPPLNMGEPHIF